MIARAFASQGGLSEKKASFPEIGEGFCAFTAKGDETGKAAIGHGYTYSGHPVGAAATG